MFRKLVLTALAATGMTMAPAAASRADASEFGFELRAGSRRYDPGCDRHYPVYYRPCDGYRWRLYGTYESHARAHRVEHRLEHLGYNARVVHH